MIMWFPRFKMRDEQSSQWRNINSYYTTFIILLFIPQSLYRIFTCCFIRLKANCEQSNKQSKNACQSKYPPGYVNPVSKILEPFIHCIPCNRACNYDGDTYTYNIFS